MKFNKTILSILFFLLFFNKLVYANPTQSDQFKFMGSVAALAELCHGSMIIPDKLNTAMVNAVKENPAMEELFNKLIEHYNEGYYEGVASNLIWNYHLDPPNWSRVMDCSKDSDGIKDLEQEILSTL